MQKKWIVRIAFFGLILTLVTTLVLTGTLAKYITTNSGSDTGTVAAFGASVTVPTVESGDYYPGVEKSMTITFAGTPEVDVEILFDVDGDGYSTNWLEEAAGDPYYPLVFTATLQVSDGLGGWDDIDMDEVEEGVQLIAEDATYTALGTAINNLVIDFDGNTTLSEYQIVISWEWPFESENDAADTYIGSLDPAATFELGITATIRQTGSEG